MAKRSHPALYEVINKKGPLVPPKSPVTPPTPQSPQSPQSPNKAGDSPAQSSGTGSKADAMSPSEAATSRAAALAARESPSHAGATPVLAQTAGSTSTAPRSDSPYRSQGSGLRGSEPRPEPSPIDLAALLTPGRLVRLPVGYVWIAIGAIIAAVVLSYVVGHASGRRLVERERDLELAANVAAAERVLNGAGVGSSAGAGVARDPLRSGTDGSSDARARAGRQPTGTGTGAGGAVGTGGQGSAAAIQTGDPRVSGHHYYVLAHGTEEGAPRMAAFLRDNGVDARVVNDHNGRLRKVIALPGLAERADQSTPAATALRASIEEGLRKWRQSTGDRSRRSPDYYLEQHGAQPQR